MIMAENMADLLLLMADSHLFLLGGAGTVHIRLLGLAVVARNFGRRPVSHVATLMLWMVRCERR